MKSITITAEQTAIYDSDTPESVALMRELRRQAQQIADSTGETVEIYTADGIVADAVE